MVWDRQDLVVGPVAVIPGIGCFVVHPVHDGFRGVLGLLEHNPHGRIRRVLVDFLDVHDTRRAVHPRGLAVVEFEVFRGTSASNDDHTLPGYVIVQSVTVGLHIDVVSTGGQLQGVLALIVGDGQVVGTQGHHNCFFQRDDRAAGRIKRLRVGPRSAVGDRNGTREGSGVGYGVASGKREVNRGDLPLLHYHIRLHLWFITAEHGQHGVSILVEPQYFVRTVGGGDPHSLAAQFLDLNDDTASRFPILGDDHTSDTGGLHDQRVQDFHLVGFDHHVIDG